jgi:DNA-binding FadR family transcriptional regulator
MIDRRSGRPLYQQLADELRRRILSGELSPGADLPSEKTLEQTSGLGRGAVRRAVAILRNDGRVVCQRGRRSQVRASNPVTTAPVPAAAVVRARMPAPEERARFDLPDGVPVLVVALDHTEQVYPADRVQLQLSP